MKATAFDRRAHPAGAKFSIWQAEDGWPIRLLEWLQPEGTASRGSIIFASGRGDFIEKYLEPLAHWHQQGWNVASFDWRSQGQSRGDIKGGHLDSFDPLVADGGDLISEWIDRQPGPHVAVGHSMGGHLLLRILAERRLQLGAAVLVAPMIGINSGPVPVWASQTLAQSLAMAGMSRVPAWSGGQDDSPAGSTRQLFLTSCLERYSDELWWLGQEPGFALGAPSWGWLNAAYRSMESLTDDKLRKIPVPTLIVATETDRLVSADAIRRAAGHLPAAELLMFPDAAHEILREGDPVRLEALARIDGFLAEHARE